MIFVFLVLQRHAYGQEVEHNYLVGPQVVTCDSLELTDKPIEEQINLIRSAKYRFDQSFTLTRKTGLQRGEYYACDNKIGFLIIKYNGSLYLYKEVEKDIWDKMITSSDPEGFYLSKRSALHAGL